MERPGTAPHGGTEGGLGGLLQLLGGTGSGGGGGGGDLLSKINTLSEQYLTLFFFPAGLMNTLSGAPPTTQQTGMSANPPPPARPAFTMSSLQSVDVLD